MVDTSLNKNTQFISGKGEMSVLTKSKDWSGTAVGKLEGWPQSLRTAVSIILNSKFPMFLFWGSELTCFYNDAYRPSLGINGKHPSILGMKGEDAWKEIWDTIKPLIDQVLSGGEATWSEDQLIPIYRNGKIENVYWTFSYSALTDESGKAAGVFVTCMETTKKVITENALKQSKERFEAAIKANEGTLWTNNANGQMEGEQLGWAELTGQSYEEYQGYGWAKAVHPEDAQPTIDAWNEAVKERKTFIFEHRVKLKNGEWGFFSIRAIPLLNGDETIREWVGVHTNITDRIKAEQEIRESEDRFRNMAEGTEVLIAVADESSNATYFNKSYVDLTGRSLETLLKFGWVDLIHPHERNSFVHNYIESFKKREAFTGEVRLLGKKGDYSWLFVKAQPRFRADGSFAGYISSSIDITERKNTEDALRDSLQKQLIASNKIKESEDKLNMVIDASELGTFELDLKTDIVICSERFHQIFGYTGGSTLSHAQFISHLYKDDLDIRNKAFEKSLEKGFLQYQSRIILTDQSIRWIEVKGKVFYDDMLKPAMLIGTCRDVTPEKNYQHELKESEQKFRLLADSMPQHIWTSDTLGNLNYFNKSVFDYSGLTLEQINKEGWLQIVHPDDREGNIQAWMHSITTGNDFLFEHRFRRYDGEYRWQLSRAIAQKDFNGSIHMWVGTSTDVHDQKTFVNELEIQVQERTKELAQNNMELEKMNKELQSFAYISSHDLQEPLRKIQTFAFRILEKEQQNLSENGKNYFHRMQEAAKRMQNLIDDLLSYSRTSTAERKFEHVSLKRIVDEVKQDLKEDLQQKNAVIKSAELCEAKVIPFQFRQLMVNLIGNSLKFSSDDNLLEINIKTEIDKGFKFNNDKLTSDMEYCHITISDNGIGFEPEYNEKIFELFQRLHGREAYTGTGIGLSIVKKIVENHNGVIEAHGEPNKGATFNIYLPV